MGGLIIKWMFNGEIIVAIACLMALTIYTTIALIRILMEELKK